MADLMGVMLKSLGVDGGEIMKTAEGMQVAVKEIHAMLATLIRQNEIIIVHLAEHAPKNSAMAFESDAILTRMVADGRITGTACDAPTSGNPLRSCD
jgi:hypothetical protein